MSKVEEYLCSLFTVFAIPYCLWCLYDGGWQNFKMMVFVIILGVVCFSLIGFCFHLASSKPIKRGH